MDAVLDHLKAFVAAVKDDPFLSDAFRAAANDLHDQLAELEAKPAGRKPKQTTKTPDAG
jgi:hypothetical protein